MFYLLSKQFPHNLWDSFDLFYIANTEFWTQATRFDEAAELTLAAAEEMRLGLHLGWVYSWIETEVIVDAFAEVGICCTKSAGAWDCSLLTSASDSCPVTGK